MKWKDHTRLIIAATQQHNVPYSTHKGLMEGVIYPDKTNSWRNKQGKRMEFHHHPDKEKIIKLIWRARRCWLNGDENKAGFQLGCALHYIHDGVAGKGFLGLFHGSNENKLREIDINYQILSSGINESRSNPFYIENLVLSVQPENPEKALDRASYITAFLIKGVFSQECIPIEVENEYKQACIERRNVLVRIFSMIRGNYESIEKKWKWFNNEN